MTHTHWTLAETLQRYGQKAPALAKASGLSKNTVYDILNGKSRAVTLETLDKLLNGLERLTGTALTPNDLIGRAVQSDIDPELLAQLANIPAFNWQEVRAQLPSWTEEERAANEQFWLDLETDRKSRGDRRMQRLEAIWDETDPPSGSSDQNL